MTRGALAAVRVKYPAHPPLLTRYYLPRGRAASNEDCLYLHVYAPQTTSNVKLPVMFWIFGGGYVMGDGYEFGFYDGMNMATKYNAIVVARTFHSTGHTRCATTPH